MDTASNMSDLEKAIRYIVWKSKQSTNIDYVEFYWLCTQILEDKEMVKEYANLNDKLNFEEVPEKYAELESELMELLLN